MKVHYWGIQSRQGRRRDVRGEWIGVEDPETTKDER